MKTKIIIFSLFLTIFFLFFAKQSASATHRIKGPDGERVKSIELITEGNTQVRLISSGSSLYSARLSVTGIWTKNKLLYDEPTGTIAGFSLIRYQTGNIRNIYIFNGDNFVKLSYNVSLDTMLSQTGNFNKPAGSTSFIKLIVWDKIYFMSYNNSNGLQRIYNSSDEGKSWEIDTIYSDKGSTFNYMNMFYDSNKNLFLMGFQTIYVRYAGNDTCKAVTFGGNFSPRVLFIDRNDVLHVSGTNRPHLTSTDIGKTWQLDTNGLSGAVIQNFADDSSGAMYAFSPYKLFVKENANANWKMSSQDVNSIFNMDNRITDFKSISTLEIACNIGVLSSNDKCNSIYNSTSGVPAKNISGLQFFSNGKVAASTSLGISLLNPSDSSWTKTEPKSGTLTGRQLYKDLLGNLYYIGNSVGSKYGAFFVSSDGGNNWFNDSLGFELIPLMVSGAKSIGFIDEQGGQHMAIGKSIPSSTISVRRFSKRYQGTWDLDNLGFGFPNPNDKDSTTINQFASDKKGSFYFNTYQMFSSGQVGNSKLYKRPITGGLWESDKLDLSQNIISGFATDNSGVLYASTYANPIDGSMIYYKGSSGWEKLPSIPASVIDVKTIAVDSAGTLYIVYANSATNRGIYATGDKGKTWMFAGLDNITVNGLTADANYMFAYTNNGIYQLSSSPALFPKTTVNPKAIDFGNIIYNQSKDTLIKFTNTGNDTLRFDLEYSNSNDIIILSQIKNIPPGKSDNLNIRFKASRFGNFNSQILIQSNDFRITINLQANVVLPPNPAVIKLSNKTIDFQETYTYSGKDSTFIITNTGKDTLIGNIITLGTNTKFNCNPTTFKVLSGESKKIGINFYPTDTFPQNSKIMFYGNFLPDTMTVSGKGVTKPFVPTYILSKKVIDFGKMELGSSKDTVIQITADKEKDVQIIMILTYSGFFTITPNNLFIPAGDSKDLKINCSPHYEGVVREKATINPSNGDSLILIVEGILKNSVEDGTQNGRHSLNCSLSPNPVGSVLNLKINNPSNYIGDCRISIYNIVGIQVKTAKLELSSGEQQTQIRVGMLPPGVYFVSIDVNGIREFLKFEKVE
ncbi:MAG: receptor protein kinase-like protein [Ignavibacteria bacterium]|nr:receptor protein kinase-like protein [Ignavibacteria bacterium]